MFTSIFSELIVNKFFLSLSFKIPCFRFIALIVISSLLSKKELILASILFTSNFKLFALSFIFSLGLSNDILEIDILEPFIFSLSTSKLVLFVLTSNFDF